MIFFFPLRLYVLCVMLMFIECKMSLNEKEIMTVNDDKYFLMLLVSFLCLGMAKYE